MAEMLAFALLPSPSQDVALSLSLFLSLSLSFSLSALQKPKNIAHAHSNTQRRKGACVRALCVGMGQASQKFRSLPPRRKTDDVYPYAGTICVRLRSLRFDKDLHFWYPFFVPIFLPQVQHSLLHSETRCVRCVAADSVIRPLIDKVILCSSGGESLDHASADGMTSGSESRKMTGSVATDEQGRRREGTQWAATCKSSDMRSTSDRGQKATDGSGRDRVTSNHLNFSLHPAHRVHNDVQQGSTMPTKRQAKRHSGCAAR